jgi:hypothetical protein
MQQVFLVPNGEKHSVDEALDLALARDNKTDPFWVRLKQDDPDMFDLLGWKTNICTTCSKPSLCCQVVFEMDDAMQTTSTSIICSRCDPKSHIALASSLKGSGLMNDPMRNTEATFEWPEETK